LHITSDGNSMQMFIGQADGARAKAGVAASAKNTIPLPLSTAFDALGLTVSAEAGIGTGGTKASGEGVTLRMLAEDTDAESMRRRFGSVMSDLAQSSFCVGEGKDYGDVLGMLFDRHDSLSVSNSSTRSKSGSGRTYVAATASLKAVLPEISMPTMPNPLKPVPNPLERKTALSGKLASHNLRDKSQAFDTTGAVKVRNFSITAKHNVDATAGFGVGFGRGVYGRGGVHSLSVVSEGDTVVAHHTRTSTRYNNRKEFKAEVEADRQRWLEILAQKSSTPGLSKAEKLEVAERQLDMHLSDAKDFDHVWIRTRRVKEGEFQVVRALNERAARVWNDLESAARVVQSKGDGEAANEIRTLIGELINDERSWEPADLLSGTQGSASSVLISSLLPVRESSGAATAARSASSLLRNPGPA
ncbi:MAG TPA: hypothetical protein VFP68_00170, partial [Burkholderiaceae bacterium]|nr:hypothetical protein [Burkholderiaceae bacterium]